MIFFSCCSILILSLSKSRIALFNALWFFLSISSGVIRLPNSHSIVLESHNISNTNKNTNSIRKAHLVKIEINTRRSYKYFPVQINHTIPIISINSRAIHSCECFQNFECSTPKMYTLLQTLQVKLQTLWDYVLCVELSTFRSPFNCSLFKVNRHLVTWNWYI